MANIVKYTTSKGEVRYRVRYRKPDGTQTDKRGFKRKKDAENWAAEHVTIAKATGTFIDPQAGNRLFRDMYESWLSMKKPFWKPSQLETTETSYRTHVGPKWGGRRIGDITNAELQEWVGTLALDRSASVVLRAKGIVSAVLDRAVEDRLIAENPCKGLDLPRKPVRKERRVYLPIPRLVRFAEECGKAMNLGAERRALVLLLGFCGLRWGEAAGLRREDVDLERGLLTVRHNIVWVRGRPVEGTPKSYEMRNVPMPVIVSDALRPLLAERHAGDRVFSDTGGGPIRMQSVSAVRGNRTWWPSALKRLGWEHDDWPSPHDLRHTAASIAVHAGANVKALQRMLGHKSAAMTLDVYADLFDSDLMDVSRMVGAAVELECGQNVGKKELVPAGMA
ncbi:tyrosine-type recombinase/integrase [Bifidobacterium miconisargentati]|uniref:tyrosine-type recombinase/integrase n=1 Tax=Bifidobacterium miconisargentati TaxID=2834437 RepID=UPI001BDC56E8|nr:tyrosine-type recombinase/integrase [Bifidobacterium miconisargentati]MBW3090393.1 site-specific integrase [Bifidobacterium miconisargentati]